MSGVPTTPPWRFLVDENLPRSLASDLVALGYVAEHVYDSTWLVPGMPSSTHMRRPNMQRFLSGDKDVSDIRVYPPPHAGIVVVEVPDTMPPDIRKRIILRQLATLSGQSLANTLTIIEPSRLRIRRPPP